MDPAPVSFAARARPLRRSNGPGFSSGKVEVPRREDRVIKAFGRSMQSFDVVATALCAVNRTRHRRVATNLARSGQPAYSFSDRRALRHFVISVVMADEPAKIILGDTAISAVERSARRRWFGRGKDRQPLPLTHCENCGAELVGPPCTQCRQAAIAYRRSFRH